MKALIAAKVLDIEQKFFSIKDVQVREIFERLQILLQELLDKELDEDTYWEIYEMLLLYNPDKEIGKPVLVQLYRNLRKYLHKKNFRPRNYYQDTLLLYASILGFLYAINEEYLLPSVPFYFLLPALILVGVLIGSLMDHNIKKMKRQLNSM